MSTHYPYTAWFDQTTRRFSTLASAKQWIANRLGRNNTTDDYGIQHLDPIDHTVIPDLLGADATPHPADPFDTPAVRDITHGDEVPLDPIASATPTSSPSTIHSKPQDTPSAPPPSSLVNSD